MVFPTHRLYSRHVDPQTESLLHSIADAVHSRSLAHDRQSVYRLALHMHRHALQVSGTMLSFRLIAHGVSQSEADRMVAEVDHYRELLALYDRERV